MFDRRFRARRRFAAVLVVVGAIAALISAPGATAKGKRACENRANVTYRALLDCVTLEGVRAHQAALQAIADANDGNRAAGTSGYEASVDYVVEQLEDTNWDVEIHEFDFTVPQPIQQHTPVVATHAVGGVTGSTLGTVNTIVTPIDINLVPPRANTSGCQGAYTEAAVGAPLTADPGGPDDFAGFVPGRIALVQRGGCSFALKVANAQTAGAAAVILFNQGDTPARSVTLTNITAEPPAGSAFTTITVPIVGTSFAAGEVLAQPGTTATVAVINVPQKNVIAELDGRNDDNIVMAGGHLDGVEEGPGINDNGSGSAALLETAIMIAKSKPQNRLRFAWWGGEEAGLLGSQAYVDDLSAAERDRIALYMNYDMVGSPNYIFMVYDADKSTFLAEGIPIPPGSTAIEDVYESFYTLKEEPYDDTEFSGRSDYEAFIFADIPSSGLFTGAEEEKTAEQAAIWGGTVDAQFDPCYHDVCDTYANNNDHALDVNSDLIAFAALTFAYSTETVNGVAGKKVPDAKAWTATPAGPEGTFPDETLP
jgi:Zn-dependent M28 family amino/carboxypeptidase